MQENTTLKNAISNRRSIIEFCFFVVILIIVTYVNRNKTLIWQSNILDAETYQSVYSQFESSRFVSYLMSVVFLIIRCFLGAACVFLGGLMDSNYSKLSYKSSFDSLVKAQWFLVLMTVISYAYYWITGSIPQLQGQLSLSALPFIASSLEPTSSVFIPAIIVLQSFNVFQLVYLLLLALYITKEIRNPYLKTLWFVFKTYGLGYVLFHISIAFVVYSFLS